MLWLEPIHLGSAGILILFRVVRVLYTAWWGMSNHFNNTNHRKERLLGMCQPRKVHSAVFFQWQKSCQSGSIQRTVSDRKAACLKQWNGRKVGWDFLNHLGKDKRRGIDRLAEEHRWDDQSSPGGDSVQTRSSVLLPVGDSHMVPTSENILQDSGNGSPSSTVDQALVRGFPIDPFPSCSDVTGRHCWNRERKSETCVDLFISLCTCCLDSPFRKTGMLQWPSSQTCTSAGI